MRGTKPEENTGAILWKLAAEKQNHTDGGSSGCCVKRREPRGRCRMPNRIEKRKQKSECGGDDGHDHRPNQNRKQVWRETSRTCANVDSPHDFAWRLRAGVTGNSLLDRVTRRFSGSDVETTVENWCGNLVLVTAKFRRTTSYACSRHSRLFPGVGKSARSLCAHEWLGPAFQQRLHRDDCQARRSAAFMPNKPAKVRTLTKVNDPCSGTAAASYSTA